MTTTSIRPGTAESTAAAWAAHRERERVATLAAGMTGISADLPLLRARRAVAEAKPGCATAILNPDPNINWDRGRLVQDEIRKITESGS